VDLSTGRRGSHPGRPGRPSAPAAGRPLPAGHSLPRSHPTVAMSTGPTLTTGAAGPRLDRPDVGRCADRIRHDVVLTGRGPGRLPRRLVVPVALMLVMGPLNRAALPDHAAAGPPRALTGSLGAPALLLVARLNVLLAVGNVAGLPVRHPTLLTLAVTRAVARRPRGGACLALVGATASCHDTVVDARLCHRTGRVRQPRHRRGGSACASCEVPTAEAQQRAGDRPGQHSLAPFAPLVAGPRPAAARRLLRWRPTGEPAGEALVGPADRGPAKVVGRSEGGRDPV
jgi:hypothetical protein